MGVKKIYGILISWENLGLKNIYMVFRIESSVELFLIENFCRLEKKNRFSCYEKSGVIYWKTLFFLCIHRWGKYFKNNFDCSSVLQQSFLKEKEIISFHRNHKKLHNRNFFSQILLKVIVLLHKRINH